MSIRTTSKVQLFFLEFLVVIIMLSLAAVVAAGLFVKAKEASTSANDLTCGVFLATTTAERFYSGQELEPAFRCNEEGETDPQGEFLISTDEAQEGNVSIATITVEKDNKEIYSLEVKSYRGGEQ
ncbi:MAG: hypothetical protein Q4C00_06330 [Bacillota bacterium]|nr:hypothetical protein [Bacillota bacterium]